MELTLRVNGTTHHVDVEPRRLLSDVLRGDLGLTGTHVGCEHGVCGCCTPGFLMSALPIYREAAAMSDEEVREALGGQLCRCTGYVGIITAVRAAAAIEDAR